MEDASLREGTNKVHCVLCRAGWVSSEQEASLGHQHCSPLPSIPPLSFLLLPIFPLVLPKTTEICCASQAKLSFAG